MSHTERPFQDSLPHHLPASPQPAPPPPPPPHTHTHTHQYTSSTTTSHTYFGYCTGRFSKNQQTYAKLITLAR